MVSLQELEVPMRFELRIASLAALVVAGIALGMQVSAQDGGKSVVHVSSKDAKWSPGPAKGVETIALRGDMEKGPHCMFARFEPGADHGWHTHTNDVTLVVLEGAYLFKDEHGKQTRVAAGEYLFVPGGLKHWSGGDPKEGAIFFQESPGKFDLVKADAPKK
jgi:quercetin dioxygenase-like cupin family protein